MILFNGCSFVWGDELPGYDDSPPSHIPLRFSTKLAERYGETDINLASCGGGNDKIFRDTVRFLSGAKERNELPTKVVILWSAWQRAEVAEAMSPEREEQLKIQRMDCMTQISPHRYHSLTEVNRDAYAFFYKNCAHSYRTDVIHHLDHMISMQLICDSLGIKLVQGIFHGRMWNNVLAILHHKHRDLNWGPFMDKVQEALDILRPECRVGMGYSINFFEFAKDKYGLHQYGHPNAAAHNAYAKVLYDIFEEKYPDQ